MQSLVTRTRARRLTGSGAPRPIQRMGIHPFWRSIPRSQVTAAISRSLAALGGNRCIFRRTMPGLVALVELLLSRACSLSLPLLFFESLPVLDIDWRENRYDGKIGRTFRQ